METVNGVSGEADKGSQPPPSPLTGCYLLIVIGEPHNVQHKDIILQKVAKGLLSWNVSECLVDLEKELSVITEQGLEGEEARYGERLIQFASENLVTEILIHPVVSTLAQCMRNLLSSFTRHRHIIHAGYTFAANGSWALQDGTFSYADFAEAFQEIEVKRVIRAYENGISIDIHCSPEGEWTKLPKENFSKACKIRVNPSDVLTSGSPAITDFNNYLAPFLIPASLENLLESSDVVGNIRFSRPTLYIFPGGQGDAALFGINGFNMLLDGGFSRKACFWDFVRHLDRLDAVLMTRLNNSNIGGISSVLTRKRQDALYPQIGHFFCNLQERKSLLSPDGDKDKDPLLINLLDEGQEIIMNLRHLNLFPQVCYRDSEPINLYHKVGHGTLDMYVLSPAKDSKEVREFLQKWNQSDQKLFASIKSSREFTFPVQNLVSIAALLVWRPANPNDTITRILYPGSSPQKKLFEGLDRLRNLECIRHAVCTGHSLMPVSTKKTAKENIIEKMISKEKMLVEKKETKIIENNVIAMNGDAKEKVVKKSDSTESERSLKTKKIEDKIENGEKPKPKPKPSKPRTDSQQRKKPIERKDKTSPKKTIENGDTKKPPAKQSPINTPAKSTKDANNRKVIESKAKKEIVSKATPPEPKPKVDRKPISRRPKETPKAPVSPVKKLTNGVQKPDSISKKAKLDKEGTTDSSTVSTPSADQESMKKDISKLTPEEIQRFKAQELADLQEEQEAVKEIEAVFRKSEVSPKGDEDHRVVKDISLGDKDEKEDILIVEKVETETDSLEDKEGKEDETQKLARDSEESEKIRKLSKEEMSEKLPEIEEQVNGIVDEAEEIIKAKDESVKIISPEEKVDTSADKKIGDKDLEEEKDVVESQPDEKVSVNIKSGDTTTAPTLPEDERIPLDEIKEDNGQIIEEKYVKEETKEKEIPIVQPQTKPLETVSKVPNIVGIKLDKQAHVRDLIKTPDEVADLPVHEEVDYEFAADLKQETPKTNEIEEERHQDKQTVVPIQIKEALKENEQEKEKEEICPIVNAVHQLQESPTKDIKAQREVEHQERKSSVQTEDLNVTKEVVIPKEVDELKQQLATPKEEKEDTTEKKEDMQKHLQIEKSEEESECVPSIENIKKELQKLSKETKDLEHFETKLQKLKEEEFVLPPESDEHDRSDEFIREKRSVGSVDMTFEVKETEEQKIADDVSDKQLVCDKESTEKPDVITGVDDTKTKEIEEKDNILEGKELLEIERKESISKINIADTIVENPSVQFLENERKQSLFEEEICIEQQSTQIEIIHADDISRDLKKDMLPTDEKSTIDSLDKSMAPETLKDQTKEEIDDEKSNKGLKEELEHKTNNIAKDGNNIEQEVTTTENDEKQMLQKDLKDETEPADKKSQEYIQIKEQVQEIEKTDKLKEADKQEHDLEITISDLEKEKTELNEERDEIRKMSQGQLERMELGRKSPKEREEDVIKIVTSVAEVLKSDAPLEEFEGKLPYSPYSNSFTTELRETHITTMDSPMAEHPQVISEAMQKEATTDFVETEKVHTSESESDPTVDKRSLLLKQSQELMLASSRIISDIKSGGKPEEKLDDDDAGRVHRMLVTASCEDGGEETEICAAGTIMFSRSSESSGRSSPEQSQKVSQKSSIVETISESLTKIKVNQDISSGKDSGIDDGKSDIQEKTSPPIAVKTVEQDHLWEKAEELSGKSSPDSERSATDTSDVDKSKEISSSHEDITKISIQTVSSKQEANVKISEPGSELKKPEDDKLVMSIDLEEQKETTGVVNEIETKVTTTEDDNQKSKKPTIENTEEIGTKLIEQVSDSKDIMSTKEETVDKNKPAPKEESTTIGGQLKDYPEKKDTQFNIEGKTEDIISEIEQKTKDFTVETAPKLLEKHVGGESDSPYIGETGKDIDDIKEMQNSFIEGIKSEQHEENIRQEVQDTKPKTTLKDVLADTISGVESVLTKTSDHFGASLKQVKDEIEDVKLATGSKIEKLHESFIGDIKANIEPVEKEVKQTIHELTDKDEIVKIADIESKFEASKTEAHDELEKMKLEAKQKIQEIGEPIKTFIDESANKTQETVKEVKDTAEVLKEDVKTSVSDVKEHLTEVVKATEQKIEDVKVTSEQKAEEIKESFFGGIKAFFGHAKEKVDESLKEAHEKVKELTSKSDETMEELTSIKEAVKEEVKDDIKEVQRSLEATLKDHQEEVKTQTESKIEEIKELQQSFVDSLDHVKDQAAETIKEAKESIKEDVNEEVVKIHVKEVQESLLETLKDRQEDVKVQTESKIEELKDLQLSLVDSLDHVKDQAAETIKETKESIKEDVNEEIVKTHVKEVQESLLETLKDHQEDVKVQTESKIEEIKELQQSFIDGLDHVKNQTVETIQEAKKDITVVKEDVISDLKDVQASLLGTVKDHQQDVKAQSERKIEEIKVLQESFIDDLNHDKNQLVQSAKEATQDIQGEIQGGLLGTLKDHQEDMKAQTRSTIEEIKDLQQSFIEGLDHAVESTKEEKQNIKDIIEDAIKTDLQTIETNLTEASKDHQEDMKAYTGSKIEEIKELQESFIDGLDHVKKQIVESVVVKEEVKPDLQGVEESFLEAAKDDQEKVKGQIDSKIAEIKEVKQSIIDNLDYSTDKPIEPVKEEKKEIKEVKSDLKEVQESLLYALKNQEDAKQDISEEVQTEVQQNLFETSKDVKAQSEKQMEEIKELQQSYIDSLDHGKEDILESVKEKKQEVKTDFKEVQESVLETLKGHEDSVKAQTGSKIAEVKEVEKSIIHTLDQAKDTIVESAEEAKHEIITSIDLNTDQKDFEISKAKDLAETLTKYAHEEPEAKAIKDHLDETPKEELKGISSKTDHILEDIKDLQESFIESMEHLKEDQKVETCVKDDKEQIVKSVIDTKEDLNDKTTDIKAIEDSFHEHVGLVKDTIETQIEIKKEDVKEKLGEMKEVTEILKQDLTSNLQSIKETKMDLHTDFIKKDEFKDVQESFIDGIKLDVEFLKEQTASSVKDAQDSVEHFASETQETLEDIEKSVDEAKDDLKQALKDIKGSEISSFITDTKNVFEAKADVDEEFKKNIKEEITGTNINETKSYHQEAKVTKEDLQRIAEDKFQEISEIQESFIESIKTDTKEDEDKPDGALSSKPTTSTSEDKSVAEREVMDEKLAKSEEIILEKSAIDLNETFQTVEQMAKRLSFDKCLSPVNNEAKSLFEPEESNKVLEQSAKDLAQAFETMEDMTKSIVFEKCEEPQKREMEEVIEKAATDMTETFESLTDMSKSVIFDTCAKDNEKEKSDSEKEYVEEKKQEKIHSSQSSQEVPTKGISISEVKPEIMKGVDAKDPDVEKHEIIEKSEKETAEKGEKETMEKGSAKEVSINESLPSPHHTEKSFLSDVEIVTCPRKSSQIFIESEKSHVDKDKHEKDSTQKDSMKDNELNDSELQKSLLHEKHVSGAVTPPTAPVSPNITEEDKDSLKTDDVHKNKKDTVSETSIHSDISDLHGSERLDSDEEDQFSVTSQVAHSRELSFTDLKDAKKEDTMSMSFYGKLPSDDEQPVEPSYLYEITKAKFTGSAEEEVEEKQSASMTSSVIGDQPATSGEKCEKDTKMAEKVCAQEKEDPIESWGKPLGLPAPRTHLYEITNAKYVSSSVNEEQEHEFEFKRSRAQVDVMSASFYGELPSDSDDDSDPIRNWGKPLGLPSPAPPYDNKGTPKKEKKLPPNVSAKNKLNDDKKRAESPNKFNKNKKIVPVYVDLTYVPHHGNAYYAYVDFFRRVRARYYVFSGIEPSREVYNALLEAKQTWEDKELEVTIIPTYDTDVLGYWVAENEEILTKYKIDLSPSASRCTINLQDHETSCSAYRLEF